MSSRSSRSANAHSASNHHAERIPTYRISLALVALLAAGLVLLVLILLHPHDVQVLVARIRRSPASLTASDALTITVALALPLAGGVVTFAGASTLIAFMRLSIYRNRLRRFVEHRRRLAIPRSATAFPLTVSRIVPGGDADGTRVSTARLVESSGAICLLGAAGSGKSVTVLDLVVRITGTASLLSVVTGRFRLPVVLYGALFSAETLYRKDAADALLRLGVRPFASRGLELRMSQWWRKGRLVILVDSLDTVAAGLLPRAAEVLAELSGAHSPRTTVVICSDPATVLNEGQPLRALSGFDLFQLNPVEPGAVVSAIKARWRGPGGRSSSAADIMSTLQRHLFPEEGLLPSLAAAIQAVSRTSPALPYGDAQLYREYVMSLVASDTPTTDATVRMLGVIAASMLYAGTHAIPLQTGRSIGRDVANWLEAVALPSPLATGHAGETAPSPEEIEHATARAVSAGILQIAPEGASVSFRTSEFEPVLAAMWLGGFVMSPGALGAHVLRSEWIRPVLMWAGMSDSSADLASAILHLSHALAGPVAGAEATSSGTPRPTAVALALGVAAESLTVSLAQLQTDERLAEQVEIRQQRLRDMLDALHGYIELPANVPEMADALSLIEASAGTTCTKHLCYIARHVRVHRLIRAQIIVVLGLIGSPDAIRGIVALLDERDPIIRQATSSAVSLAGALCIPPLQQALSAADERLRARAGEVLALLGAEAVSAALASLSSAQESQRAEAARVLGALRAADAVEPLIARLDDSDRSVRTAAAHALGQIASTQAVAGLESRATSGDAALRAAVIHAIGASRDASALAAVLQALRDQDSQVRIAAAEALGKIGDERAVISLQEFRDDRDPWMQNAVLAALRRLGHASDPVQR